VFEIRACGVHARDLVAARLDEIDRRHDLAQMILDRIGVRLRLEDHGPRVHAREIADLLAGVLETPATATLGDEIALGTATIPDPAHNPRAAIFRIFETYIPMGRIRPSGRQHGVRRAALLAPAGAIDVVARVLVILRLVENTGRGPHARQIGL